MSHHRTPSQLVVSLVVVLGGLLAAPLPSAHARPLQAEDIATRVQQFYDVTRTFQARFKQTYQVKVQNAKKVSTGTVAFQKPGKLSFRYDKPNGNRVVSDGKTIQVYERDNQQMFVTKVQTSQYPAALAFLLGKGKLLRDFKLRLLDASRMQMEGGYVLECVPKEATPAYTKLLMYVDAQTSQVRRVLILDAQGNRNRFDFEAPVVNRPIPDQEFQFTPPPGTTIVKS